jgi:catecholate siderophore receptor
MKRPVTENPARKTKRRLRSWMTIGAVAASTSLGQKAVVYAQQAAPPPASKADHFELSLPARRFDIPAGPLSEAMKALQSASGITIVLQLPEGTIDGFRTAGVAGEMTPDRALNALLADTGLQGKFVAPRTALVTVTPALETVNVTARPEQVGLATYTEPIRDTPQTISVVSQEVMQEQAATTLRDALRNVASISMAAGEGGSQGDNLTIRGFTARNDIFLDGARDFGSYYRDPFNYQEVEVLEGPSSVTFGRGSTGGVINQVSKSPDASRFLMGNVNFGTNGLMRGTADYDQPLPALGEGTAFRLNAMGTRTDFAGRDDAEYRRWGIAPSLVFGLGSPTRVQFSYFHQAEDDVPDYGIPWLFNRPANVDRSNYYGFPDNNYLNTNVNVGTIRVTHDTHQGVTLNDQLRYAAYTRDAQISEAQIAGNVNLSTPLSSILINRNQIAVASVESLFDNQFDVTSNFRTGGLQHSLVTGVEVTRETSDPTRFKWAGVPQTSLLYPDDTQLFAGAQSVSSKVHTTAVGVGLYAIGTLKLSSQWQLVGGVRWDYFNADYHQSVAPASAFSRVDTMPSYRAALVFIPHSNGSIYFDYGTSFNPSAESLSLSAATANLPPVSNRTYEGGTKWAFGNGQTTLRAAIFRTEVTNAREPDPNNPLLNILSGFQVVDGFEFQAAGRMTQRWNLQAGYALLNSELAHSVGYPGAVGSRLANVPRNNFTAWTTYDLPWRLQIGGGGNYVGSRTASSTSPIDPITGLVKQVPGYWVLNAMGRYQISERMDLQVNITNLADRCYYDQIHPAHIVPGEGRTAILGLNYRF